ncbi:transposase [Dokdonia pacifica]|uniref:Toprim-like n=1 Tax=Dokdonia pacifica TaxID=1627892 RepID=A0A239AHA6_9FLAO|nr:toprim domain-containing protein [Dokdonia pacifica]GGG37479.1 transposase [Dokdonia pacifica]SNR94930.1 Toprim-like [Dokdonia pacifica]
MNIKQAKEKFTLQSLLTSLGHYPNQKKSKGNDLWYKSPFRPNEQDASFHIDTSKGFYKDFGDTEKGGDLIWFAQMYLKSRGGGYSVSDALKWFDDLSGGTQIHSFNSKAFRKKVIPLEKQDVYTILSNKEIFSSSLIEYLKQKNIALDLAKKYFRQIYFLNTKTKKKIYGLGFETRAGGFDIRTANGFKTMIGNKDITLIEGCHKNGILDVFEGATDFLSLLTLEGRDIPKNDCIILNSGNLYKAAADLAKQRGYYKVKLWLDNDEAGHKFQNAILKELNDTEKPMSVFSMNHIYKGFKDLNAWHKNSHLSLSNKKNALQDFPKRISKNFIERKL